MINNNNKSKSLGFECCGSHGLSITSEFYKQIYKLSLNITAVLANLLQFWCLSRKAGDFLLSPRVLCFKVVIFKIFLSCIWFL